MPRKTARRRSSPFPGASCFNEAAARCRGKPAAGSSSTARSSGFNEAAARCRGKPRRRHTGSRRRSPASMRPRPDAAENRFPLLQAFSGPERFNEAAARCRGKPSPAAADWTAWGGSGFNEAAARCRGKPRREGRPHREPAAGFNEAAARCRGKPGAERRAAPPARRLQ